MPEAEQETNFEYVKKMKQKKEDQMAEKNKSLFERLSEINVSAFAEKKGKFTYLSWAWAVTELKKVAPEAYWTIHEWGLDGSKQPYQQTEAGCFVKVTVIAEGIEMTQVHPVLDHQNKTVKQPTAFEVNTSIMRCLTKAISLHGLGLYIYAGEDLPEGEKESTKAKDKVPPYAVKDRVNTGHNPDMQTGGAKSTAPQLKYVKSLRSQYLEDFGEAVAQKAMDKLDKQFPEQVTEMTKQVASNYINELLQEHARLMEEN